MSEQTVSFVKSAVERCPGLRPVLEEHTKDNLGEVLPHVFLGDVTRYVLSLLPTRDGAMASRRELREILECLEAAYAEGDEELRELISVSFLENLPRPGEIGDEIREMVGPNLRKQLDMIG